MQNDWGMPNELQESNGDIAFNTHEFICGAIVILVLNMERSLFSHQMALLLQFVASVTMSGPVTVHHTTVG